MLSICFNDELSEKQEDELSKVLNLGRNSQIYLHLISPGI